MLNVSDVEEAVTVLEKAATDLRPELLFGRDAARVLRLFSRAKRICASVETALLPRLEETKVHEQDGYRSLEQWFANEAGTTFGQARAALETGKRLLKLPDTTEAFRHGDISAEKAREVADGAGADPSAEAHLLEGARTKTVKELRDEVRRVKAAAEADPMGAYERLRRARSHRSFVDRDGMVRGEYAFPPDQGARFRAAHAEETTRLLRRAAKDGVELTPAQASADALFNLVTGKARARGIQPKVIFRIDLPAYRRGCVRPGEVSEIRGVGPVPVEIVRDVVERDALIAAVIAEGSDLRVAKSFGRHLKADVRAALDWAYDQCGIEGCDVSWGLEYDHWEIDYAESGVTGFGDVSPLCSVHHDMKTYGGYRLVGEPGHFRLLPSDDGGSEGEGRDPP